MSATFYEDVAAHLKHLTVLFDQLLVKSLVVTPYRTSLISLSHCELPLIEDTTLSRLQELLLGHGLSAESKSMLTGDVLYHLACTFLFIPTDAVSCALPSQLG